MAVGSSADPPFVRPPDTLTCVQAYAVLTTLLLTIRCGGWLIEVKALLLPSSSSSSAAPVAVAVAGAVAGASKEKEKEL